MIALDPDLTLADARPVECRALPSWVKYFHHPDSKSLFRGFVAVPTGPWPASVPGPGAEAGRNLHSRETAPAGRGCRFRNGSGVRFRWRYPFRHYGQAVAARI